LLVFPQIKKGSKSLLRNQIQVTIQFFILILPASVWVGVFDQTINLAAFVACGEILGDRQPRFIDKKEAVAIFPLFHLIAGTKPTSAFNFLLFIGIEITRAQRATQRIHVVSQP
jgi:hypothetical protein